MVRPRKVLYMAIGERGEGAEGEGERGGGRAEGESMAGCPLHWWHLVVATAGAAVAVCAERGRQWAGGSG